MNSSVIPEAWTQGIIQPIHKKKGDIKDPTSYRPITLVSCLGKTFTAVLNTRLGRLADEVELISEAQTGFRKGYSTLDNMFTLYALISIYFSFGKKLYCTFVDFSRAFDNVPRHALWQKLLRANVRGKMFNVIYCLYDSIKSCVKSGDKYSAFLIVT